MARICVIRQLYFPLDPRVRREVDALLALGHSVDVICMRRPEEPRVERLGRLTIRRLPLEHRRGGSLPRYLYEYGLFFILAAWVAALGALRGRYDVVQVNSPPDTLVFAALAPRLRGARVLLDLQECMPEFFATKFKTGPRHPGVRLMAWLEGRSIRFADYAITPAEPMRGAFAARGADPSEIGVVVNGTDESLFDVTRYPPRVREPGRFVLICHGSVDERYGLDTTIRAVALLKDEIPGLRFEIYGEGAYRETLRRLARDLGVEARVYFSDGFVPLDELLRAIADADAGVVAMKRDAFRDLTLCLKMFDFIAMRKPILMSRTRSVEAYFDEACFEYFTSDDPHDLARAIRELYADPGRSARMVEHTASVSEPYRWVHQREVYREAVERLLASPRGKPAARGVPRARPDGAGRRFGWSRASALAALSVAGFLLLKLVPGPSDGDE